MPARSSRWPGSSAPAAARSRAPSSASTRYDAGAVTRRGRRLRGASPTAAMAAGRRLRARGSPPAGARDGHVDHAQHRARLAQASPPSRLHPRLGRERASPPTGRSSCRSSTAASSNPISSLSGGNQQKVVLAKWLGRQPSLLIVDEPTRGIDVATKAEVHRLLDELAAEGVAILMISSELPEVLARRRSHPRHARGPSRQASSPTPRPPRRRSWQPRPARRGGGRVSRR